MRVITSVLVFSVAACVMFAQAPVPTGPQAKDKEKAKDNSKDKPKTDKPKLPPSPLDKIEGYKRQIVEGFTVMLSTEAGEGEIKDAEVKPLEALALEFQMLKKVMPAKQIEMLQKLPVWVEWDEYEPLGNGREGKAIASYSWASMAPQLAMKKIAFKSRCVIVHSLKLLTEGHQPSVENQTVALLREFAHAVHEQILGIDNPGIKAAYKLALEHKLYDRAQAVCARETDFFGELTCAYFDQLHHYPKTRDELKKHDPNSLQLLESIWGTPKKPAKPPTTPVTAAKPKTLAELNGSDSFDMKVKLADLVLGATVIGTEFKADDGKDAVVVLANFGGDELIILEKLARLHEELSPYGAKIVVAHSPALDADAVKKKLDERGVLYTGLDKALTPQYEGDPRPEQPGHTMIFNEEGQCVFRGSGYDAIPHARAAVAKKMLAKLFSGGPPKALAPVVEVLSQGSQPILEQIPKIAAFTQSPDPEVAAAAKSLASAILAPANTLLAEAQTQAKTEPLSAFITAEKIIQTYKGTSPSAKALTLMDQLRQNPAVAKELKARKLFEPIKKLDQYLMAQPGSNVTLDDRFQKPNKQTIDQLVALNSLLKKAFPMARCTEEAAKITAKYSLGD